MISLYERGEEAFIPAVFVDAKGAAASITGTPTITIYYYDGSSIQTAVNAQDMTQKTATQYYYNWSVGGSAQMGTYAVLFSVSYSDGTTVIALDTLRVVANKFMQKILNAGAYVQETGGLSDIDRKKIEEILELLKKLKPILSIKKDFNKLQSDINLIEVRSRHPELEGMSDEALEKLLSE